MVLVALEAICNRAANVNHVRVATHPSTHYLPHNMSSKESSANLKRESRKSIGYTRSTVFSLWFAYCQKLWNCHVQAPCSFCEEVHWLQTFNSYHMNYGSNDEVRMWLPDSAQPGFKENYLDFLKHSGSLREADTISWQDLSKHPNANLVTISEYGIITATRSHY